MAEARQLFQDAAALEAEGKWTAAAEKLRRAASLKETPGLRYHLAFAEEQSGQLVQALQNYQRAEALIAAGQEAPDVEAQLGAARERVEQRIPRITLELPSEVPDAQVMLDGAPVADPLGEILLDPGPHELRVVAPGRVAFVQRIEVSESQRQSIAVTLPERPPPASPLTPPQPDEPTPSAGPQPRTFVLAGGAVLTLAALSIGAGYAIERSNTRDRVEQARAAIESENGCISPGALADECVELEAAIDDHNDARRISTMGFVAAGVLGAATVATWLLWEDDRPPIDVSVGPEGLSLGMRHHF